MAFEEARAALRALVEASAGSRGARSIGDWTAVLQFDPAGPAPSHLVAAGGRLALRAGRHPKPTATVTGQAAAVARAARAEIDITHLLADGSLDYTGNYYDLINFSRVALATRPKKG